MLLAAAMFDRTRAWRAATPFVLVAYLAAVLGGAQGFVMCWEAAGHTAIETAASATQIHGDDKVPEPRLAADEEYVLRTGHEFICLDLPAILELGRTDWLLPGETARMKWSRLTPCSTEVSTTLGLIPRSG